MTRILLAVAASLLLLAVPAGAADIREGRGDCIKIAVPFDLSGSMKPYLEPARDAVIQMLRTLRPCDVFIVLPFAETRLESFRRELTPGTRDKDLADAETFIRRLRTGGKKGDTFGHYTNLDEGIDAARLALLTETAVARGVIVLISDGLSDPDPQHRPVDRSKLGERVPKDGFNLYLVDLSGTGLADGEQQRIGEFTAAAPSSPAMVVIPITDATRLGELLRQLEQRERAAAAPVAAESVVESSAADAPIAPQQPEAPDEPRTISPLWWLLPVPCLLALSFVWLRRRKRREEPIDRRRVLHVSVDDREQRHALPAKLTIGGADRDSIRVPGARPRELRLRVDAHGNGSFRQNGTRGLFFGSRDFELSNKVQVRVRAEELRRAEREVHRYVAAR